MNASSSRYTYFCNITDNLITNACTSTYYIRTKIKIRDRGHELLPTSLTMWGSPARKLIGFVLFKTQTANRKSSFMFFGRDQVVNSDPTRGLPIKKPSDRFP